MKTILKTSISLPEYGSCWFASRCCLLVIAVSVLLINNAKAQVITSVSGTVSDGQTVTINGSGFGVKLPAAPVIWDNFEAGYFSSGWDKVTVPGWVVYRGEGQVPGSAYALRADRGGVNSVDLMKDHAFHEKLYISLKRRWDFEVIDRNQKFLRIYDSTRKYSIAWNYLSESPVLRPEFFCRDGVSPYVTDGTSIYSGVMPVDAYPSPGKWLSEEFFIKMPSATGACDGEMGYRVRNNLYEYWPKNRCIFPDVLPGPYQLIFLDNFGGPLAADCEGSPYESYDGYDCLPPESFIWVDDIYIDDTWARVVAANNPVYGNAVQLEIQPPIAWSDSSIQVTFNQGSFNNGDIVYMFVVDKDGNVNETGYPIKINPTDTEAPFVPNSLKVH